MVLLVFALAVAVGGLEAEAAGVVVRAGPATPVWAEGDAKLELVAASANDHERVVALASHRVEHVRRAALRVRGASPSMRRSTDTPRNIGAHEARRPGRKGAPLADQCLRRSRTRNPAVPSPPP